MICSAHSQGFLGWKSGVGLGFWQQGPPGWLAAVGVAVTRTRVTSGCLAERSGASTGMQSVPVPVLH